MFLTKYTNKIQVTGTLIKTEEKYFFFINSLINTGK